MERLSPSQIFSKTAIFVLLKVALSAVAAILSIIVLSVVVSISSAGGGSFNFIGALIWILITVGIVFLVNYFAGYFVKAGHAAIVADAAVVGMVPEDQLKVAKEEVDARFVNCNAFFSYRMAVRGSVNQIQKSLNVFGSRFDGVPVMAQLVNVAKFFVGLSLSFVLDCCLGYTFNEKDKGLYKSSAESVMAYRQNWRGLVDNSLKLAGGVILTVVLIFFFATSIFAAVFTSMYSGNVLAGLMGAMAVGYFIAAAVKNGIIDSYLMISLMEGFLNESRYSDLTQEAFGELYRESSKFAVLYNKAKQEDELNLRKEETPVTK